MLVPISEMREPVVIRIPVTTIDESGGEVQGYADSDPLFVSVRALSARESQQFGQLNADITHVFFGHWHDLGALDSDARLRMIETEQEFDIVGPPINSPTRDWTKLTLVYRENG